MIVGGRYTTYKPSRWHHTHTHTYTRKPRRVSFLRQRSPSHPPFPPTIKITHPPPPQTLARKPAHAEYHASSVNRQFFSRIRRLASVFFHISHRASPYTTTPESIWSVQPTSDRTTAKIKESCHLNSSPSTTPGTTRLHLWQLGYFAIQPYLIQRRRVGGPFIKVHLNLPNPVRTTNNQLPLFI